MKQRMKPYKCEICGYIYDPVRGEPKNGIKPGTAFEDLPDDYICPVCGAYAKIGKSEFVPMEAPTGRYRCVACGYLYDPERGNQRMESNPGLPLRICQMTISARYAVFMPRSGRASL